MSFTMNIPHQRRHFPHLGIYLGIATLCIVLKLALSDPHSEWTYNDQKSWSKDYKTCSGKRQSPIDIETKKVVVNRSMVIERHLYDKSFDSATIVNNGHSVQLTLNIPEDQQKPYITGSALNNEKYIFEQLHFHWSGERERGSEHAIDGKLYAMEMHLVHWNQKYGTFANSTSQIDGLAVIGVFFQVTRKSNLEFNSIVEGVRKVSTFKSIDTINENIELDNLLPNDVHLFYRYKGSLTTPPCYESVSWIVFPDPNGIGLKQIDVFRHLLNDHKEPLGITFRDLQSIKERTVFASDNSAFAINSISLLHTIIVILSISLSLTAKCQHF